MGRDNVFRRHNEMVARSRGFKMSWVGWQTPGCPCKAVWAPLQMLWDKLLESLEWGLWISFCRQMDGSSNGEDTLISTVTFSIVRSPGKKKKNLSQVCGRIRGPSWQNLGAINEAELFRFVYLRSDFVLDGKRKRSSNGCYLCSVCARCCRWHSVLFSCVPQNTPFTPMFWAVCLTVESICPVKTHVLKEEMSLEYITVNITITTHLVTLWKKVFRGHPPSTVFLWLGYQLTLLMGSLSWPPLNL